MKDRSISRPPISFDKRQDLTLSVFLISLVLNVGWILYQVVNEFPGPYNEVALLVATCFVFYFLAVFFVLIPLIDRNYNYHWLLVGFNYLSVVIVMLFQEQVPIGYFVLLILSLLIMLAVLCGRWPAYGLVIVSVLANSLILGEYITTIANLFQIDFILLPAGSILIVETIIRLESSLVRETRRLQTLNNVARSLSSTLEMHQVIAQVTSAIQSALLADTYYVGLVNGDIVHMELLYDDGEFFPGMDIPLKDSLAERVISTNQPLLIGNIPQYLKKGRNDVKVVGQPRVSMSWMGCTLETREKAFGLIAVASYKRYAFDESDLDLLVNLAQQASVALTNAGHHAEVESRSKLDSLTGVLNHNAFLSELDYYVREAKTFQTPLSLIMLDIDHFKAYNDTYGHLVGDTVLVNLSHEVKRIIKKTDRVGRWGGEEFAIVLPNTQKSQAYLVAKRISTALSRLAITDRENQSIPCPTISQGIAVLPDECHTVDALLDMADRRLYKAKERGRNQIEPDPEPGSSDKAGAPNPETG